MKGRNIVTFVTNCVTMNAVAGADYGLLQLASNRLERRARND